MRFLGWDWNVRKLTAFGAACASLLAAAAVLAPPAGAAASIPAWLDDAIAGWNKAHADSPIKFIAIRDSWVWYAIPAAPEATTKDIRERVYTIARQNGYANTADEEIVTPGTPPVLKGTPRQRKCWTRSFLRALSGEAGSTGQRMLTTMVCEVDATWAAGFRVLE